MQAIFLGCIVILFILFEKGTLVADPLFWLWVGVMLTGFSVVQILKKPQILLLSLAIMTAGFQLVLLSENLFSFSFIYLLLLFFNKTFSKSFRQLVSIMIVSLIPILMNLNWMFLVVHVLMLLFLFYSFWKSDQETEKRISLEDEYNQLLLSHRKLKRQFQNQESDTRASERTRIARDIHDTVGHQLTALTMQLEMLKIKNEKSFLEDSDLEQAKNLATDSLEKMRSSVHALQNENIQGFGSVLQLIRRLEAESHVRVDLTTRSGVLSAALSTEHMIVIYRIVQEGLTNAMRHGQSREVEIIFEIIGERGFSLTMKNKHYTKDKDYQMGFGLSQLQQRVKMLKGRFTVEKTDDCFVLAAFFPIQKEEY
ncbi:hypothetical protein BTS2_0043 [Bacillus sp. TS-2]|nr:hypothetical protein BTS2_0043 [Bacillus sp. TS-2]